MPQCPRCHDVCTQCATWNALQRSTSARIPNTQHPYLFTMLDARCCSVGSVSSCMWPYSTFSTKAPLSPSPRSVSPCSTITTLLAGTPSPSSVWLCAAEASSSYRKRSRTLGGRFKNLSIDGCFLFGGANTFDEFSNLFSLRARRKMSRLAYFVGRSCRTCIKGLNASCSMHAAVSREACSSMESKRACHA